MKIKSTRRKVRLLELKCGSRCVRYIRNISKRLVASISILPRFRQRTSLRLRDRKISLIL